MITKFARLEIFPLNKLPCSELQGIPSGKFVLRHDTPQQDCGVFRSQNKKAGHRVLPLAKDLKADGIIHYSIQFCTHYMIESHRVAEALEKEGIPLLKIETDYSVEDVGQLSTRIQAFLEMIS